MNPDTGKFHELVRDAAGLDRIKEVSNAPDVEMMLKRALESEKRQLPDSEPPPGTEVPPNWPRFSVGEEFPWKGWFWRVEYVDAEGQRVVVKPLRPTRSTRERQVGKKRRRRKGGRR